MRGTGYEFRFDPPSPQRAKTIFADPGRVRSRKATRYLIAFAVIVLAWGIFLFSDALTRRPLKTAAIAQNGLVSGETQRFLSQEGTPVAGAGPFAAGAEPPQPLIDAAGVAAQTIDCRPPAPGMMAANAASDGRAAMRVFAYMPSEQARGQFSLARDCGAIDVLLPDWFAISQPDLALDVRSFDAESKLATGDFLKERGAALELYPVIGMGPGADRQAILRALGDAASRKRLFDDMIEAAEVVQADGFCLDFGRITAAEAPGIGAFVARARASLAENGLQTCLILRATDEAWQAPALREASDFVVVKTFIEPWSGSPTAPSAPEPWFAETVDALARHFGKERLIVALGTASYDWISGVAVPEKISFGEAMARIERAGAQVTFAPQARNPQSIFRDRSGRRHHLWMLDAATLFNQLQLLRAAGIGNVAVWDLGNEDSAVWNTLVKPPSMPLAEYVPFTNVLIEDYLSYTGKGPFIRVTAPARIGQRVVTQDPATGRITALGYTRLPQPVRMERFERPAPGKVALTFDDGPDPKYTRAILDELKALNVPAGFFVIGSHIWQNRDLIRRMIDEGHLVGSHSFWHPDMRRVSESRNVFELNMTQRVLSSATGRTTLLFREPYQRTEGPLNLKQATPVWEVQNLGYIYVSSNVAPHDWEDLNRYQIAEDIVQEVEQNGGNVIALHDGGGDRAEVVAAVPLVVKALRARGYEFVSLADLLGLDRATLMPKAELAGSDVVFNVSFRAINSVGNLWRTLFLSAIAIGVVRSLIMLVLAIRRKPHFVGSFGRFAPPVSVVIPAYNEEDTIIESVNSVLALNYPNLEVVVVDDGSTDRTFDLLLEHYSRNPKVQIIAQFNQGKWRALNVALESVSSEFVICIDADTRIDERSVLKLVGHFRDPLVGAVAGKVKIINRKRLLTKLQVLEYMVAQEIDRRAAETLNAMMVVPGAIGAWRVSAVKACGGYSGDTMTEDADLTVTMNRLGYTICYEENAVAETRAPETVRQLLSQRARWSLGMLQLARKHRGAVREGHALGWFALPDLIIFGYVLAFLAPVADLLFLSFLVDQVQSFWFGQPTHFDVSPALLLTYAALPLVDLVVVLAAHAFDRSERASIVLLSPVQRLVLRPLLYFTAIRAVWRAITGRLVKWTKAHRAQAQAAPSTGLENAS